MTDNVAYRNQSPYGWWIASYVERAAWDDDPNPAPNSRCLAWENTIILQAPDRDAAYEKAIQLATGGGHSQFESGRNNRKGHFVFEGLTSLLAIHDELTDGAEVLWQEHRNRTVQKVRSWVKQKHELESFDDSPSDDE